MAIKKTGTKYPITVVEVPYKCSNEECEYAILKQLDLEASETCPLCGKKLIVMYGCTTPDLDE